MNFYDRLFATAFMSTLMLISIPVSCVVLQNIVKARDWYKQIPESESEARRMNAFINKCWGFFISLCFILFPPVSERAFLTLVCMEMEPGSSYLMSDLSIKCEGDKYNYWTTFAYLTITIYTVGIPLSFWYILWSNQ